MVVLGGWAVSYERGTPAWQVYSGPVKTGGYGSKDFLQVQDLTTGETEYFRFAFL